MKDNLRLICSLHSCLDITEKDFTVLSNNMSDNEKSPVYNLEWLGVTFAKSKSKNARRESIMNKSEIKEFKMKSKSLEYNFLRSVPKIETTVQACGQYELSRSEYPFVEEPKNLPNVKLKNYNITSNIVFGGDAEDEEKPYLIVFVIGGLAHNEICALERLTSEKKMFQNLVIGSTSIITANQFMDQLKRLTVPGGDKPVNINDVELGMN